MLNYEFDKPCQGTHNRTNSPVWIRLFLTEVWPVYTAVTLEGSLIRLSWGLGLIFFYLALHFLILKMEVKINRIVGAILAFGPFLSVFFIGYGGPAATGALTFLSASLLLAGIKGDSGCEVMSIPALFTGKHTHLACLLFSPIDWCERSIRS